MGDMTDLAYEQAMREEMERDENPEGAYETFLDHCTDPFIWTRADFTKKHIKDLNAHHTGNVLRYIEKNLEGYTGEWPDIYFNLLVEAKKKGIGLTDFQIDKLLETITKPKPVLFAAFDKRIDYENYRGTILALEEDEDEVALVVVDEDGAQKYKLMTFKADGKAHIYGEIPADSKIQNTNGYLKTETVL